MKKSHLISFLFLILFSCTKSIDTSVHVEKGNGSFSLISHYLSLRGVQSSAFISANGSEYPVVLSEFPELIITEEKFVEPFGAGTRYILEGGKEGINLSVEIKDFGENFVLVKEQLKNNSTEEITLKGFSFKIDGNENSNLGGKDEPDAVLVNGYQSWSPAIVTKIMGGNETEEASFINRENNDDMVFLDFRISWWFSVLHATHQSIISGAITSERWKTRILTYSNGGKIIWKAISGKSYVAERPAEDKVRLPPGSAAESESIFIGIYEDPFEGIEEYSRQVAIHNQPPPVPFAPIGWNSWNTFFDNIDEQKILNNAEFIKENFPTHGFNNIQIDDGWEKSWGEWEPNDRFPSGMDSIAQQLNSMGFIPGIWIAPFLVSESAPVFNGHKDWLLKDENGEFLKYSQYYILDTTNPEALNWIKSEIQKIINWGYRYIKIDFLFAGAYEGKRFDSKSTSMNALRRALKTILEIAKEGNAYVLLCGAPILPSAGLGHGIRIGADIALKPLQYTWAFVKNEARNIAARYFLNIIFANDPDTALLRDISIEEAQTSIVSTLFSGRLFALGDDLISLPQEKIQLITKLKDSQIFSDLSNTSPYELSFKPLDLFKNIAEQFQSVPEFFLKPDDYPVPELWWSKKTGDSGILGIFNWSSEKKDFEIVFKDLGLINQKYSAMEFWSEQLIAEDSPALILSMPPHSSILLDIY